MNAVRWYFAQLPPVFTQAAEGDVAVDTRLADITGMQRFDVNDLADLLDE